MPGFIRTKKDEALWEKAKRAAAKSKGKDEGSFTDQDWALVNHIYHKMKKSEDFAKSLDDPKIVEELVELLKASRRPRLSDESLDPMEEYSEEDQDDLGEGFREFDPDEEESSGEAWLRENDPEYGRGDQYDEYSDYEDEDSHQRAIAEDIGHMGYASEPGEERAVDSERGRAQEGASAKTPSTSVKTPQTQDAPKPEATPSTTAAATQQQVDPSRQAGKKLSRFRQPTREELIALRAHTRPWEQRARDLARLQADPRKNPVLAHQGAIIEARNTSNLDKKAAYQKLISSDEYKNADPITQMEMDEKFEAEWKAKNPDHLINMMRAHHEAHSKGKLASDIHRAAKDEKIQSIISGNIHSPDAFSTEEGLQHVGGVKGEDGIEGSIVRDPTASFAANNKDFIEHYAKQYSAKSKKPINIQEMMDYNEDSKRDLSRILGPAPSKDQNFEKFFSHYYPLIGINAHKAIKKLGLDPKHPDIDMSMLHEAGMHGLIQAINDYDHDNPSKASFATHAANKIRGLQMTALRSMDAIPAEIRQAHKRYTAQERMKRLLSDQRYSKGPDVSSRLKRIDAHRAMSPSSSSASSDISSSTAPKMSQPASSTPAASMPSTTTTTHSMSQTPSSETSSLSTQTPKKVSGGT